ncbi:MAG: OmpA family protein [Candidatus Eisenbacteria bacterium]|nr:OmpA family protein [Candidatus Eisenbacteria bacterium]
MAAAIAKDGFIALDVHFDTGKSEILPESQPLIAEMAAMLKQQPSLRLGVEGHTDNTGTAESNWTSRWLVPCRGRGAGRRWDRPRPARRGGSRAGTPDRRQPHGRRAREEPARGAGQAVGRRLPPRGCSRRCAVFRCGR